MSRIRIGAWMLGVALGLMAAVPVHSASLTVFFSDPTGDGNARGDVVGANLTVDNASGSYEVRWTSSAANPFSGDGDPATDDLVLNLNLGNARRLTLVPISVRFNDVSSTTQLVVTGTDAELLEWLPGDGVVTFGDIPPYPTRFTSGLVDVRNPERSNRDHLEARGVLVGDTDPSTVPASTTVLNLAVGLAALGLARRRQAA